MKQAEMIPVLEAARASAFAQIAQIDALLAFYKPQGEPQAPQEPQEPQVPLGRRPFSYFYGAEVVQSYFASHRTGRAIEIARWARVNGWPHAQNECLRIALGRAVASGQLHRVNSGPNRGPLTRYEPTPSPGRTP